MVDLQLPNLKEALAMIIAIVTPLFTGLLTIFTDLKIVLTSDQKFILVLVSFIVGTFFLVSILFISEMQKRRVYKEDVAHATEISKHRPRLVRFVNELQSHTGEGEWLKDIKAHIDTFYDAIKPKPKPKNP